MSAAASFREPNAADIEDAVARLRGWIVPTPMLANTRLDAIVGARVLVKPETLQVTGSFKARGAFNRLLALTPDERRRGIVAWSAGNHAKALAFAGAKLGVHATIVMPADAPRSKIDATASLGAMIRFYDRKSEDREAIGHDIAAQTGAIIVPPYDDAYVMAGGGTAGLELLDAAASRDTPLDAMLVCTGGGGLIAGCAIAAQMRGSPAALHSVEPEGYDDTRRSLAAGARVANDPVQPSSADALLTLTPGVLSFAVNQKLLAPGLVVTEAQIAAAVRFAFEDLKLVVEPGGAAALAAALFSDGAFAGRTIGIVLTGANVDPDTHAKLVSSGAAFG